MSYDLIMMMMIACMALGNEWLDRVCNVSIRIGANDVLE